MGLTSAGLESRTACTTFEEVVVEVCYFALHSCNEIRLAMNRAFVVPLSQCVIALHCNTYCTIALQL